MTPEPERDRPPWLNRATTRVVHVVYVTIGLPLLFVLTPWFLIRHLRALAGIRRLSEAARFHRGNAQARVLEGALMIHTSELIEDSKGELSSRHEDHRFELGQLARVERTHFEGDGGFADANTEHFLLRVVVTGGDDLCVWVSDDYGRETRAALFDPLLDAGLLEDRPNVPGLARGFMLALLYAAFATWILAALGLAAWIHEGHSRSSATPISAVHEPTASPARRVASNASLGRGHGDALTEQPRLGGLDLRRSFEVLGLGSFRASEMVRPQLHDHAMQVQGLIPAMLSPAQLAEFEASPDRMVARAPT